MVQNEADPLAAAAPKDTHKPTRLINTSATRATRCRAVSDGWAGHANKDWAILAMMKLEEMSLGIVGKLLDELI